MSYVGSGEKVFSYQDPTYPNCTPPTVKRSDHRLKRFQSVLDKRAWNFCEEVRYRHFRDLFSGSRTCLGIDTCHRYVPLDDLIKILMADKDAFIKDLQRQLCNRGDQGLESQNKELKEELNKSRDMLRKAMHKLENIDEIVNENKRLQCRLRCSEERVKYLEDKRRNLESELAELRSKSQIQMDLEKAQEMLCQINREKSSEMDEAVLQCLALERNQLQEKVKNLEKELEESKKKEAEIEMLKKQSQSDSIDKEEMSRENECYKRKLASMKCLERQIQELKKQGKALADKYKREAQKAAEQMNKMCQAAKELQGLRQERDSLRKRVNELASYECQYNRLQRKLQCVDAVIAENEELNCKLLALQKLEEENEYLRCRLEAIQEMEMNAAEDKERITQLQCAVADQEEEMKDLLCQIERLTSGKNEEELERLKCELYEKDSKLKLCQEQLAEIPMLEAEIDELRMKLQCCCKEFQETKRGESSYQKVQVRLPASSTGIYANYKTPGEKCSSVIGIRREERVHLKEKHASCQELSSQSETGKGFKTVTSTSKKKDVMSCDEVQNLLQSSKGIISCVLEDMREHQKEMEELETCNKAMKEELETLKARVGGSDKDCLLQEICDLKRALEEKELEISRLKQSTTDIEGIRDEDVKVIKELNREMKAELEAACSSQKQGTNIEKKSGEQSDSEKRKKENVKRPESKPETIPETEAETEAETVSESRAEKMSETKMEKVKGGSEEVVKEGGLESCRALQRETEDLKLQIEALNRLTEELKKENELLRELQKPCPDFSKELDEKCALENLLSLLQAELDAYKGQKLSDECEALRNELKRVMEQNCQLKALVDCYRQRLDLEKESNELTKDGEKMSDCWKELEKLRNEKNDLQKRLETAEAGTGTGAERKETDCLKELEQLRKEKNDLQKRLETAEAGTGTGAERKETDCLKELEQLRKEKNDLQKRLETAEAGTGTGAERKETDCLKELEQLRKEKNDLQKRLETAEAGTGTGAERKETDCLKELEQMRKEKANLEKQLNDAKAQAVGPPGDMADLLKQLEDLKREKNEMATQLNEAKGAAAARGTADAECEEKLKKLMEQHAKELADREKTYNDNLNAMKAGYETDIRKLADRHKQSIMKLQDLHEGEVQEMNLNYENQLEQSQTALKDLANELENKYNASLDGNKKEFMEQLGVLQNSLNKSKEELDALKKKDGTLSADKLKAQQNREMQKARRASQQKLDAMKKKLEEERKQSADEIESLKSQLKDLEKREGVCDCKFSKKKPPKPRDPTCPLDFNEVLEKILEEGLDCLTFNEIALVHRKVCCALEGIVMNSKGSPILELEPPVGDSCVNLPLLEADKQQLLNKIFALENDIVQKQKETQEAIISMEVAIKKERCRLQEVRNSLQNEQQRNSELKLLLSSQTKIQEDLKKERERMGNQASLHQSLCQEKSKRLDEEMRSKKCLEGEVERLRGTLKHLSMALDAQRGNSGCLQGGEQMEMMRAKLEQTTHQERKLALQLERETKCRMQLQYQLQSLRQSLKHMVNLPAVENISRFSQNPLEAKCAKEKQNLDQVNEKKNKTKTKSVKRSKK